MPISSRLLLLTSLLAPASLIPLYLVYRNITPPGSGIQSTLDIPTAFREYRLIKVINPYGNPLMTDSWTYTVPRKSISWLSATPSRSDEDEERKVLAHFVRGFFGGRVFAFEQWLLSTFRGRLRVGIDDPSNHSLNNSHEKHTFWTWRKWSTDTYAPYGAAYLNAFQLLDSGRDRIYADDSVPRTFAAILFGSNRPGRSFVGMHFFSVTRRHIKLPNKHGANNTDDEEDVFELNIWSLNCDPSVEGRNRPRSGLLWGWILPRFHRIYERALMSDAIDVVRRS